MSKKNNFNKYLNLVNIYFFGPERINIDKFLNWNNSFSLFLI